MKQNFTSHIKFMNMKLVVIYHLFLKGFNKNKKNTDYARYKNLIDHYVVFGRNH